MNDRATFLEDIAAQGVPVAAVAPDLVIWPGRVPYGVELDAAALKPEWLLAGDIHIVFSDRRAAFRRVGTLDFDDSGHLRLDRKRVQVRTIQCVALYPAPVHVPGTSAPNPHRAAASSL